MGASGTFRKRLLAGFVSILPFGITIWFLKLVFQILIGIFRGPLFWAAKSFGLPEPNYLQQAVFSAIAMAILLFAVGTLIQHLLGRWLLGWIDALMLNIPGVKSIYGATKQVMNALQSGGGGSFKEVVLVPWPHKGAKAVGFVSHRECAWATSADAHKVSVYVPSTPNPTSGFFVLYDESEVQSLNISLDEALTLIVTGGAVPPLGDKNSKVR
jgi:uncharacterized membrane protein